MGADPIMFVLGGILIVCALAIFALVIIGTKYNGGTWDKNNPFTEDVETVAERMLADDDYIPPLRAGLTMARDKNGRAMVVRSNIEREA